jgi:hypothetical protein
LQNNRQFVQEPAAPAPRTTTQSAGQVATKFAYLRAAQAYMLISIPTGTSTIFGVFQAIRELPSPRGTIAALKYGRATPKVAQACAFFFARHPKNTFSTLAVKSRHSDVWE